MTKPAVPRKWLFFIAGTIWILVSILLSVRAYIWLAELETSQIILNFIAGLILTLIFYFSGFIKVVKRNIERIDTLPQSVCIFAFTAWKGYIMIAIMVTLGVLLRNSYLPKLYLAVLYISMGGSLMLGSSLFYSKFFKE